MKKILSTILCLFVCVIYSYGQIYHYSNQTEDVYNKDKNCKVGEDYIKSKYVPDRWKYERHKAAVYTLPNNNKIVVINYSISFTEKQVLYSTNGNGFLTNNGWTDHVSKLKENKENVCLAVIINNSGEPVKAIKVYSSFDLNMFKDNRFLIIANEGNYTDVVCFDYNGNEKWAVKPRNMIIYDCVFWNDQLYQVGKKDDYSYYRIIDLNSGKIYDEAKVSDYSTFTSIKIERDGISLTEKVKNDNKVRTYKINHSTNILSSIQSTKSNEQLLLKRKEYEEYTNGKYEKINKAINDIGYYYNDYFRTLQLNPRLTPQQKTNQRNTSINSISVNLNSANRMFDEIVSLAKRYGFSEEVSSIEAKRISLNKKVENLIREMGGLVTESSQKYGKQTEITEEDSTPICWQCKEKLTAKDLREGYHDSCGARIFKCRTCGGRLITKASEVQSGKCKKCGKSIYK